MGADHCSRPGLYAVVEFDEDDRGVRAGVGSFASLAAADEWAADHITGPTQCVPVEFTTTTAHPTERTPLMAKPNLAALDPTWIVWTKSSYSNGAGGMCVEVAEVDGGRIVRDSADPLGPVLAFTGDEWDAFLRGAMAGEFGTPA